MIAASPLVARAGHLAATAEQHGVAARLLGGTAVAALLGERWPPACRREPGDIDVAVPARDRAALGRLLEREGFAPDRELNALHGRQRLLFTSADGVRVDVIVDVLRMCHPVPLDAGFAAPGPSLPGWLLLLTKLQIVELTEKDRLDVAALLAGAVPAELDAGRLAEACAGDWGLWRSVTGSLRSVRLHPPALDADDLSRLRARAADLLHRLDAAPKSMRWRLRSQVGERVRWYELPESP